MFLEPIATFESSRAMRRSAVIAAVLAFLATALFPGIAGAQAARKAACAPNDRSRHLQQIGTSGGGGAAAPGAGSFQQDTTGASGPGAAPSSAPPSVGAGGFQQDMGTGPVAGGYMDSCCGPLIQQLETTANSFATNVPSFSQRFRNLNLILEGLNLVNNIVNQANTLKQSIRALRQARNQQAAAAALTTVQSQLNGISSSGVFVQDVSTPLQP